MKKISQSELDKATIMLLADKLPKFGDMTPESQSFLVDPFGFAIAMKRSGKRAEAKGLYWCSDCGASFTKEEMIDYRPNPEFKTDKYGYPFVTRYTHLATCPHCGKPLKVEHWVGKKCTYKDEVAVQTTFGEWVVTRYFALDSLCQPEHKMQTTISDIGATWSREEGKQYHYIARIGGMFYSKYWKPEQLHFAQDGVGVGATSEHWEHCEAPAFDLDAELERRGIDKNDTHGLPLTKVLGFMQDIPAFETLWKAGAYKTATFFRKELPQYWEQIKVARRNGYDLENADLSLWRDYVDMLRYVGKDTHSPHWLCPADLLQAHDAMQVEKERLIARREEQRIREQLMREEDAKRLFTERRTPYFGICIVTPTLTIAPLKSVEEFAQEGEAMHHCVFTNGYYKRESALILSAKDKEGNRLETIEVDLDTYHIVQSRGVCNHDSPMHKEIVKTMEANMWQIENVATRQRMAC